jgi:hypothetical protein
MGPRTAENLRSAVVFSGSDVASEAPRRGKMLEGQETLIGRQTRKNVRVKKVEGSSQ